MATTTTLLQHPRHYRHPLKPQDVRKRKYLIPPRCNLCHRKISADGYACEDCEFYAHQACAEAPPRIDPHPLHPSHPLTLFHYPPKCFHCVACGDYITFLGGLFRCDECDFNLDIGCALFTLCDGGGTQGKTPEQINLPLHPHKLTSFSTRHDFIGDSNCVICNESVEGDGYSCWKLRCEFIIHKRCIQDLFYIDGTKASHVYHCHPLETFLGEGTGSRRCVKCGTKSSYEFIGCAECQVFCCRDCVQVPESIQYPHHLVHNLVLLINSTDNDKPQCDSCLVSLEGEFCYGCPSCEFFVDGGCALQVLAYCDEGMSAKIELSWHEHPLQLCHRTGNGLHPCSCCEEESAGAMYACKEEGCRFLLHKGCNEIESTIIHPHHPDHPLTLCNRNDFKICGACCGTIYYLKFFCELCAFYLHAKCAAHFPTRKHYLHEHELLHVDNAPYSECNRSGTGTNASLFRCVPCNFNLHEACMELPRVVKSEIHWHSLTLHENYVEDDSGEYYCDRCEKSRDVRLGAYVCLQCVQRWAYHIECVLPELGKVYAKKIQTSAIKRMNEKIAIKCGQVCVAQVKLEEDKRVFDELMRELDELMKRKEELISSGVDPEDSV